MAKNTPPPGTSDIFPEEILEWYDLENKAKELFPLYGYGELRTPNFEYTEVFQRGLGNETEVVKKEMYTFDDRGGRSLTLRPEGTAGVMRAMLGTDVMNGVERRVFYSGPMFRGERPAAGRKRQFHQIGVENIGKMSPELDAEAIAMLMQYLNEVGINGAKLLINTRGDEEDRKPAEIALKNYFSDKIEDMCDDCKNRLENNVWRILDCKVKNCQEIVKDSPNIVSYFTEETQEYFKRVCSVLDDLDVEYKIEPKLVRGLDYYVHTVFELTHDALGGQNAIAGGGRYELFLPQSNKPLIGVGFALGMERLLMVREALGVKSEIEKIIPIFLISLGDNAKTSNIKLANTLRKNKISVAMEVGAKSMKAQMRAANKTDAKFAIICGDDELEKNEVICRNMETGEQESVPLNNIMSYIKTKIEV